MFIEKAVYATKPKFITFGTFETLFQYASKNYKLKVANQSYKLIQHNAGRCAGNHMPVRF
jgi:hypothetical protein